MKILKAIAKGYNIVLENILKLMGIVIIVLLVIVCLQVFARYLPIPPILWTTDLAIYCLLALGFLGIGWLLRKGAHVAIDIVVEALPVKGKNLVGVVTSLTGAATTFIVIYYSLLVTTNQFERGIFITGSVFNMPKWILLAFIPIGFFFAFIEFLVLLRSHVLALKNNGGK
jgi:TRAP-type C4-dicarboxylate transport system permease small subunit